MSTTIPPRIDYLRDPKSPEYIRAILRSGATIYGAGGLSPSSAAPAGASGCNATIGRQAVQRCGSNSPDGDHICWLRIGHDGNHTDDTIAWTAIQDPTKFVASGADSIALGSESTAPTESPLRDDGSQSAPPMTNRERILWDVLSEKCKCQPATGADWPERLMLIGAGFALGAAVVFAGFAFVL